MESYKTLLSREARRRQEAFEQSEVFPQVIEQRYLGEDRLLEYISQGNLTECLRHYRVGHQQTLMGNMEDVYDRYPGDSLRSYKNAMITLNTLCRIAARKGGATSFVVSSISYKYALMIEAAASVEFLEHKLAPVMLSDYCILVRDYSIHQYSPLTREIAGYIVDHLPSSLSVNELAGIFYLNPSSLSRKFKRETGFSITEFINLHRIKLAQYYLEHGYHNITEVAYMVGYSDSNYFCRIFKKITSITPTQYLHNVKTTGMLI